MSVAENIQTMQAFLNHFNPAEAGRMAEGCKARLGGSGEATRMDPLSARTGYVADESLLQSLSELEATFPDLEVAVKDTIAEGDKVAVRFAIASPQNGDDGASAEGILIYRLAGAGSSSTGCSQPCRP
jgi:hypothetical protein